MFANPSWAKDILVPNNLLLLGAHIPAGEADSAWDDEVKGITIVLDVVKCYRKTQHRKGRRVGAGQRAEF